MKKHLIVSIVLFTLGIAQANAQCCQPTSEKATTEKAVQKKTETVKLKITGMTCAGCSNHISSALKAVDGVIEHSVEYPGDLATITYDPAKTNAEAIIKVIEKTGYKAEIRKETQKSRS
ncbi:MAG: heavy-metal-associated domain-containing protein [Cyclobacteriaceae bacterium]